MLIGAGGDDLQAEGPRIEAAVGRAGLSPLAVGQHQAQHAGMPKAEAGGADVVDELVAELVEEPGRERRERVPPAGLSAIGADVAGEAGGRPGGVWFWRG